jgi:hypothetical protein
MRWIAGTGPGRWFTLVGVLLGLAIAFFFVTGHGDGLGLLAVFACALILGGSTLGRRA